MQASAIILRISEAEKYSNRSTNFFRSLLSRSQETSLRFRKTNSRRDSKSGLGRYIILLNLLLAAESNSLGRLVAPMTNTSPLLGLFTPSISTRNSVLSLREASFSFQDRAVSMESISSIKIIEGASFSAAANIFLIVFYDSPTSLLRMEEADKAKKVQPDSLARALQMKVLPFPGGPQSRIPLGGARIPVQRSGRCLGRITASYRIALTSPSPTISLKDTSKCLTMASRTTGSSIPSIFGFLKMAFFFSGSTTFMWISSDLLFPCLFVTGFLMAEIEFDPGKPKPIGFIFCSSFCLPLASASAFNVWNFAILFLSCQMVSLEVAQLTAARKITMILSQHRIAYSSFPSFMQFYACVDKVLACANFYILILYRVLMHQDK